MLLSHLELQGLRHAGSEPLDDLDTLVRLGDAPARVAVADALLLLQAALDGSFALQVAGALALAGPEVEAHGTGTEVDQLTGLDAVAVAALADEGRSVRIDVAVRLDPVLYGQLRESAVRDPRVVTALSQEAVLRLTAGWLFTSDMTAAAPSVLSVRVGDVSFATSGKERPVWLPSLLRALGGRLGRLDLLRGAEGLAARLLEASLSPDPAMRVAYARLVAAVQQPPFSLPVPSLVRTSAGVEVAFGTELVRLRQLGRSAVDALLLAEAVLLVAPDVLVVTDVLSDDVVAWLASYTEGDEATLEQVFAP